MAPGLPNDRDLLLGARGREVDELTRKLRREADEVARILDEIALDYAVEGHPRPQLRLIQGGGESPYVYRARPRARRRR